MTAGENKSGGILARKCVEKHDARWSADFTANSCNNIRVNIVESLPYLLKTVIDLCVLEFVLNEVHMSVKCSW